MAKAPIYTTTVPNGGYNYSNVTIVGTGLTYATGSENWSTSLADPYYQKKPKVKITDEDIELDGLSLRETMLAIKNELQLPSRLNQNEKLEREFIELQEAAKHYYELEKKFLEQKQMWETLKRTDNK